MKQMIDSKKFLDKLLYMGYMDEQKSEVEEVANNMTEDAYTKDEVLAILRKLQSDIEEMKMKSLTEKKIWNNAIEMCSSVVQDKINDIFY